MKEVKKLDLIQILKALSDETRIRILNLLNYRDMCVCELEVLLDINQSNASRHLNKLTNAKILVYYKVSQYVYYKINEEALEEFPFIRQVIEKSSMCLKTCQKDNERFEKYKNSKMTCNEVENGKVRFDN